MRDALSFVMGLQWADVPEPVKARVKMALLDVIGVGAGGAGFRSAQIAAGFAADHLGGNAPLLFDDRHASAAGAAFAAAMSIDALDAHEQGDMGTYVGLKGQIADTEQQLATLQAQHDEMSRELDRR